MWGWRVKVEQCGAREPRCQPKLGQVPLVIQGACGARYLIRVGEWITRSNVRQGVTPMNTMKGPAILPTEEVNRMARPDGGSVIAK